MPYAKADDAPHVQALLADMNAANIAFSLHWIKIDVDAAAEDVFTFHPMIVRANAMVGITE